ncbi:hypothetical protein [Phormidesmis sp. 146-33]
MSDESFHHVDPEWLESITLEKIQNQSLQANELDYSIQVPTQDQKIPRRSRAPWQRIEFGGIDPGTLPIADSGKRGQIGGC